MISLLDAQKLILETVRELDGEEILIEQAAGFVAADDIVSNISVAPFRNSAMDGFAVASKSVTSCPTTLQIADTLFAGDQPPEEADKKMAVKIMTGAPVPDAFDTVVRFEDTDYNDTQVTINVKIKPGQNVRRPGEDIESGETVVKKGSLIYPLDLGVLASIGLEKILVIRKPRILILSTGDELATAGQPLKFGQIYDSNSYTIDAMTKNFRCSADRQAVVADNLSSLKQVLSSNHDVIITTGGVSMGEKDFLPSVAEQSGWTPLFHKVAIKPGKPVFVATKGRQTLFGLPGNPLSAAVTCAVMVLPALKKMIGLKRCLPELTDAILDESWPMKSGRTLVWPGRIKHTDRKVRVTLSGKTSSAALSALSGSDGLIYIFRDQTDTPPLVKAVEWRQVLHP